MTILSPLITFSVLTALIACGGAPDTSNDTVAADATAQTERGLPEPPQPMQSETQIYSGGWIIAGDGSQPQFDHIIVVNNGQIIALGKRGTLDVPADSIGIDVSGKWLLPGPLASLQEAFAKRNHDTPLNFTSDAFPALSQHSPANLVLLNANPLRDPLAFADLHGTVSKGHLELSTPQSTN